MAGATAAAHNQPTCAPDRTGSIPMLVAVGSHTRLQVPALQAAGACMERACRGGQEQEPGFQRGQGGCHTAWMTPHGTEKGMLAGGSGSTAARREGGGVLIRVWMLGTVARPVLHPGM